jgi:hypothetical protein
MKILFICSCLEEGRDGVGDYTRRLAGELIAQGHEVFLLSIHDKYISEVSEVDQLIDGVCILALRIPSTYSYQSKGEIAQKWIRRLNPEWLSLQYVPYGFHPKGLPIGLISLLKQLGKGRKWHIMFHELWVGISRVSPFKHRIVGFFQRNLALRLILDLAPKKIMTSNRLYQLVLKGAGVESEELPLFSNIPILPFEQDFIDRQLLFCLPEKCKNSSANLYVGIFGTIYPQANLEAYLTTQLNSQAWLEKNVVIVGFGKTDKWGSDEFARLALVFKDRISFLHLGILSVEHVSSVLQFIDLAISCTPAQHIGKSGVFAAMRHHGVSVLLPTKDILPEYEQEIDEYLDQITHRSQESWGVRYIGNELLNKLNYNHD